MSCSSMIEDCVLTLESTLEKVKGLIEVTQQSFRTLLDRLCKGNCGQAESGAEHERNAKHCAVLAGDPKRLVYYIISKLNKGAPGRGSKEKRMGDPPAGAS